MEIIIDKENVKKSGRAILSYQQQFNTYLTRVESIIDSINNVWEGADALKYINEMREKYVVSLRELSTVIEEYGIYLERVPIAYETLDEIFSSRSINF